MKEASGELSMTAIAAIAIGAIAVIFTTLILPSLRTNITRNAMCAQAYNCVEPTGTATMASCQYLDENGDTQNVSCKWEEPDITEGD